jgi:hypothetical protein
MRAATKCLALIGLLCVPLSAVAGPPANPQFAAEEQALEGDWLGVSYDFNGQSRIPLQPLEYVTLSYRRLSGPQQVGGLIAYRASYIQAVGKRSPDNPRPAGAANCRLDLTGEPHVALLDPSLVLAGMPGVSREMPRALRAVQNTLPPMAQTPSIAYSVVGDELTLRLMDARASRRGSLSAKKGQTNLVFHLKRAEHGFRVPRGPDQAAGSKNAKYAEQPSASAADRGIVGVWVGVSYQKDGTALRDFERDQGARLIVTLKGCLTDLRLGTLGYVTHQGRCRVDTTKTPHQLRSVASAEDGPSKVIALFQLTGDDLLWCQLPYNDQGPLSLETKPGDGRMALLLRREAQP